MLHHVSVGVADVERAARFYDLVLAALGYKRVMEFMPFAVAYGDEAPELWVQQPADQGAPSAGNGAHIALKARNKKAVHDFHDAALAAGGSDDGGPGPRPQYSPAYYGAFVRDLDGNKIEAMLMEGVDDVAPSRRGGGAKRAAARKGARGKARKAGARAGAKGRRAAKAGGRKATARGARAAARGGKRKGRGRARRR